MAFNCTDAFFIPVTKNNDGKAFFSDEVDICKKEALIDLSSSKG